MLFSEVALTLIALTSPIVTDRWSGLVSGLVMLAVTLLVGLMSRCRRTVVASLLIACLPLALFGVSLLPDEADFRPLSHVVLQFWPHDEGHTLTSSIQMWLGISGTSALPPNMLGFLAVALPIGGLTFATQAGTGWTRRALWAFYSAVAVLPVIASGSRGSASALVIGALLAVLTSVHRRRTGAVLVVLLVAAVPFWLFVNEAMIQRCVDDYGGSGLCSDSLAGRMALWTVALFRASGTPAFGLGFGVFGARFGDTWFNAHSWIMQALVDVGAIGLALLIAAMIASARASLRLLASPGDANLMGRLGLLGLATVLVTGSVDSVVETPIAFHGEYMTVFLPLTFIILVLPLGVDPSPLTRRDLP